MTAVIWLIALVISAMATIAELLVRYGNLHGRWMLSRWCQLLIIANLGAVAVSLLVLHGAGFRPKQESLVGNALALLLAETTGLGILRAGTFAGSISARSSTEDLQQEIQAIERGLSRRVTALLSFLMAKADEHVQDRHDAWRTAIAKRLLASVDLAPDRLLDGLVDAHNAVRQLDQVQIDALEQNLMELQASTLTAQQQARALLHRSIELTGENRTARALQFLREE